MTHKDNLLAFMTVARMGLFTGLLALASGMNPASGQVPSALLPNATLTASAGSGCVGQDTLTFTLGALDLDTSEIVSIDWSILLDGAAAPTSSYDLDVAVGGNLNDWSTSIVLSFVPQKSGEFTVIADPIVYTTTQQVGNQASVIVGEAPSMPSYTAFDRLFCEDENLVVLTSLSTPLPIAYSLQWEVVDLGNANVIASNAVVSDPAQRLRPCCHGTLDGQNPYMGCALHHLHAHRRLDARRCIWQPE